MTKKLVTRFALCFVFILSCLAQGEDSAVVYIYRYKQFRGSILKPSVYCDEKRLARMENGSYFEVRLSPGKHVFHSNDKQSGVEVKLRPGEKYFIRVELAPGFPAGHGRMVYILPEQGKYEVNELKPLSPDNVIDKAMVASKPPGVRQDNK